MALNLPNMNPNALSALDALGAMSSGLKPPDFSINNQFKGAPLPAMGIGGVTGGNPFSLTPGATQAATSLAPMMSGPGGAGNSALSGAANKLSSAADKLSAAADKLLSIAGQGPGAPGGPGGPGAPGSPNLPRTTQGPGFGGIGLGAAVGGIANAGVSLYGAQSQFRIGSAQLEAGLRNEFTGYRQLESTRQRSEGQIKGQMIGTALGAGLGALIPVPGAMMGGAYLGGQIGNAFGGFMGAESGYFDEGATYKDKMQTYNQSQADVRAARSSLSPVSYFKAAASYMKVGSAQRKHLEKYIESFGAFGTTLGPAADSARASMTLSGLGTGDITPTGLRGQMGDYTAALGVTATQAMGIEAGILSAGGQRFDRTQMEGTSQQFARMLSSGISAGDIGTGIYAQREGGGMRGLGTGTGAISRGRDVIERANALGLVGRGATEYINTEYSYYQNRVAGGTDISDTSRSNFRRGTESFIMRGRNLGLNSFGGAAGFSRAQEMVGAGQSAGRAFGAAIGGGSSLYDTMLQSGALQAAGGNQFQAYSMMMSMSPEEQLKMLQSQGIDKTTLQIAGMGKGLSPDTIRAITEGEPGGALPSTSFERRTKGAGAAGAAASMEDKLVSAFDISVTKPLLEAIDKMTKDITKGSSLQQLEHALKYAQKPLDKPVQPSSAQTKADAKHVVRPVARPSLKAMGGR